MADISAIKLPDGVTYGVKDTTKQPLLISGTNIKTINNESLLGSGNIEVAAGGTPIPTADTVAEFDGDAHINSEDMSAQDVEDFVDGLNVSGGGIENLIKVVKYTGTSASLAEAASFSITAPTVSGYTFLCWIRVEMNGWACAVTISNPLSASTVCYIDKWAGTAVGASKTTTPEGFALYIRNEWA